VVIGGPLVESGWSRWLPKTAYRLLAGVAVDPRESAWSEELGDRAGSSTSSRRVESARKKALLELAFAGPIETTGQLTDALVALGIAECCQEVVLFRPDAPLPGDVLSFSEEERKSEDEQRRELLFGKGALRLVALVASDPSSVASFRGVSLRLGISTEDARWIVARLVQNGYLVCDDDVEFLGEGEHLSLGLPLSTFA